ncbi:hypothetical protein ABBQ38_009311 [Trebouxia sp. C0009 RCD-2024]
MGINDTIADTRHWITEHKLKAIGGLWATGVTGSLAFQWSRPIPTQLKIIHSRVYAQAITLGAIGVAAAAEFYDRNGKDEDPETKRQNEMAKANLEKAHKTGHVHKT